MTRRSLFPFAVIAAAAVLSACDADQTSAPTPRAIVPQRPSADRLSQKIAFFLEIVASVGEAHSLDAQANSFLPVTYTSLTPSVCNIFTELNTPSIGYTSIGECKVSADQAGNDAYLPAATVTRTVKVSGLAQVIFFTSTPPVPALVNGTYTVSADDDGFGADTPITFSSLTENFCTVAGNVVTFKADGLCIVAADRAGDGDRFENAGQQRQEINIGVVAQNIEFTSAPPNPAVATFTYDVTATGGGSNNPVEFSSQTTDVCTVTGSTVTFKIGGPCIVAADQKGNAGYTAAPQKTQAFTVNKRNQTIKSSTLPAEAVVNSVVTPVATSTSGLVPVLFTAQPSGVCVLIGDKLKFVGVGVCTVGATQAGDAAYNPSPRTNITVKVIYGFEGFASPVKNGGALNSAKAGQAIQLLWRLTDGSGVPITNLTTATISVKELACAIGSTADQIAESAAGGSGLQNLGNGYYQMNWKTPSSYKGSCKTLMLTLGSGGTQTALFQFTK